MLTSVHPTGSLKQQKSRAKADELRKSGRFAEAASEYALLWPDGDTWTGWGYAHCLRKLRRSNEALEVAREVHALDPNFGFGRSIYAWTLYDIYIRTASTPDLEVLKAARMIVSLTNDEQAYAPTSAFAITVLHVAKLWAKNGRDLRVLEWLDKLDVTHLPVTPGKGVDEKGRQQELASRKEQYYSIRTHALERLGQWQECLDMSTRALSECGRLHHDNDIWFARRIALAKKGLGRPQEAFGELQQLAERKQASFLHTDIAAAAWDAGDYASTFRHALHAVVAPQDIGFKLEAVRLLAEVLWQRGEAEHARNHLRLCLAVREANGWKTPSELKKLASSWDVSTQGHNPDSILRQLRPLWERWREELTPRLAGIITKMLPNGYAGFIRADDGVDFYFDMRDWKQRGSKPVEGVHVTFATRGGFDRKRQLSTTVACEVRMASGRIHE